jgi:GNAT superfamily N-acetyltransferase
MSELSIDDEPITSSGALCIFHAAVDELDRRYGGADDAPHFSIEELEPPRGLFLVARMDAHPVGGVGLRAIGEPSLRVAEVKRLWVRPDLRRAGVAAALMAEIENRARLAGYERLYLETGWAQPEAQALYPRLGWTSIEEYPPGAFNHHEASLFTKPV